MRQANPYSQQAQQYTRVDLILEIYERLLSRLRQAHTCLHADPAQARCLIEKCRLATSGLCVGLSMATDEVNQNLLRLYEFVAFSLSRADETGIEDALAVLEPLYESFRQARPEAIRLERTGDIPALDQPRLQVRA